MKRPASYLISSVLALSLLLSSAGLASAAKAPPPAGPVQFPGNKIQQFALALPTLEPAGGTIETKIDDGTEIPMRMVELRSDMLPPSFVTANGSPYAGTAVFGYRISSGPVAPLTRVDTYVGPLIVATRNQTTKVRYINNLTTQAINWRNWTDVTLHSAFNQALDIGMATSANASHYGGPVLAVPHLHGGEVPAVIDGGPEAWFASNQPGPDTLNSYLARGPAYYTHPGITAASNEAVYWYPNTQEAAPLWFHDHLLGGTRLNATFAGLAGGYALTDPSLVLPTGLDPAGLGGRLTVPLVIQDRMFDTNGELFFPSIGINPEHPYWVPEFVGDTIVVNGKVWPYLNVDRQRYRFYIIDGSNSRPYDLFLQDTVSGVKGPPMWVIATDGGYLDNAVKVDPNATGAQTKAGVQKSLMMMPGERYEIIVDFADPTWLAAISAAYKGAVPNPLNILLRNTAPTVLGNPNANTDGRIMQFRVSASAPADTSYNPAVSAAIRTGGQQMKRLADPVLGALGAGVTISKTRELELNEVAGLGGPLEVLVNNTKWTGMRPDGSALPSSTKVDGPNQAAFSFEGNYLTELPNEGDTEIWEIVNTTMDKHPIHLHAVQSQIMNRQAFDTKAWGLAYAAAFPGSSTMVNPVTGLPYATGVLIPGFGPPKDYNPRLNPLSGGKWGGNPDISPYLLGVPVPPLSTEAGWKDTIIANPGEVTRIAVRWAPQDTAINNTSASFSFNPSALGGVYVWHCHITDHEDNEMMRPDMIIPNTTEASRPKKQGIDY